MMAAHGLTGKHVAIGLAGFFGVIFVANAFFLVLAIRSFPGESNDNAYEEGLRYNERLAERRAQTALGWRAEITSIEKSGVGGVVVVRIVDRQGRPLSWLSLDGVLRRPAESSADTDLDFVAATDGLYRADVEHLAPGAWDLEAQASDQRGETFDFAARLIVE